MSHSLEKIIELINKTGDNCVVLDVKGNPAYVVMTFDNYNRVVSNKAELSQLTEDELLNKINRDVATWKASQDSDSIDNWSSIEELLKDSTQKEPELVEIDPFEGDNSLNQAKKDESVDQVEDQYYFEPID